MRVGMADTGATVAAGFFRSVEARGSGIRAATGLESLSEPLGSPASTQPPVTHFEMLSDPQKKAVEGAVAKMDRPETMDRQERMALEAIIIPDRRPAISILNDDYTVTHRDWLHLNADAVRGRIKPTIPAVGRLELPSRQDIPYGGTAFLVGPNLLMTNRHVAELFVDGVGKGKLMFRPGSTAQMNFAEEEQRRGPERYPVASVALVHPYWDMALLRIEDIPPDLTSLTLSTEEEGGEACDVVVIGFPALNLRLDRAVQDEVFGGVYNVKRLLPGKWLARREVDSFGKTVSAGTHDSSTLGGNSGSAVISVETGQVVGLHFGGTYLVANYAVPVSDLSRDARLVDAGLAFAGPPSPIAGPWGRYWDAVEPRESPAPTSPPIGNTVATVAQHAAAEMTATTGEAVTVTIPLTITVSLGAATGPARITTEAPRTAGPWHDADYLTRTGYDPGFLPTRIPFPAARDPATLAALADGSTTIPYLHFSIAMHAQRRMALVTASNVRAEPAAKTPEPGADYTRAGLGGSSADHWFPDPRLRGTEQLPDRFLTEDRKAFDKGHLVRREDVAWGETYREVRIANGDSFHATNCSPQVAGFNRAVGQTNWGDLERAVLAQAIDQRLTIFAGPVFRADDPVFSGEDDAGPLRIQIPRAYWKLIVAPDGAGLAAYAFLLEQNLDQVPLEGLSFDPKWSASMLPVGDLERKLGLLTFADVVHDADRFGASCAMPLARMLAA